MNKDEAWARSICSFCNWSTNCMNCAHREWPSGKYYKEPRFDWEKCREWIYYRKSPIQTNYEKLKELIQNLLYKIGDFLFYD